MGKSGRNIRRSRTEVGRRRIWLVRPTLPSFPGRPDGLGFLEELGEGGSQDNTVLEEPVVHTVSFSTPSRILCMTLSMVLM